MADRKRTGVGGARYTPLLWLGLSLLATALLLPSALRPPPDAANTSAQFSPDAPPDDDPQAIIQSLQQAASRTAGARTGDVVETTTTLPPVTAPSRGQCFGDPPRQTDSLYAAPCQPAFVGDNGGATYTGVTEEEVRVGVVVCSDTTDTGYTGITPDEPPEGEVENDRARTWRVLQKYFNTNFELYGRKIRFVHIEPESNDATSGPACADTTYRNAAVRAAEEFGVFGILSEHPSVHQEGVRRHLMMGGIFGAPQSYYADNYPYEHAWEMDGTKLGVFLTDLLCRQVIGKNAEFAGDPTMHARKRTLGLILFQGEVHDYPTEEVQQNLRNACGTEWDEVVRLNTYDNNRNQTLATAIATMKANGITTVMLALDFLTAGILTHQATQQQYFPEWIVCGCGAIDRNQLIQLFFDGANQWSHAFGIMPQEIARPPEATDWWRAYKSVDPANDPNTSVGKYAFPSMLQYVNGIQRAGPNLTPETFMQGLQSMPRRPPDPIWSIGGGYGPNDYTYSDYVSLVWYDPTAPAPDERNLPGAYRHLDGGRRYAVGEIPTEPLPWFREGINSAPEDD